MTPVQIGTDNVSTCRFVFQYKGRMAHMMKILDRLVIGVAMLALLLGATPLWASQKGASSASASKRFTPGYLGIYVRDAKAGPGSGSNANHAKGAEILGVDRDAPAGKVGLKPHDVIVGIDGQAVKNDTQLLDMLHRMPAGRTIHLKITRDGKPMALTVKLASRAEVEASAWPAGVIFADGFPVSSGGGMSDALTRSDLGPGVRLQEFVMLGCDGLDVEPIGRQLAAYFGVSEGMGLLVRRVAPHSIAAAAGLQAGDVITAANGMPSNSLRGWLMVISQNQGKTVRLKVIRNHKEKMIQYTPGGHRQQSQLEVPEVFRAGAFGVVRAELDFGMNQIWTASALDRLSAP